MSGYAIYQAMKGGGVPGPGSLTTSARAAQQFHDAFGHVQTSLQNYQGSIIEPIPVGIPASSTTSFTVANRLADLFSVRSLFARSERRRLPHLGE